MSAGVCSRDIDQPVTSGPMAVMNAEETTVAVMAVPTESERRFLSFAPKYCETMMLAPTETPMNSTSSRLRIGPLAPIAASAPSPTYWPTTMESTVL